MSVVSRRAGQALSTDPLTYRTNVLPQVEVARLESSLRSLHKQLGEAEADYLTGTERLAALRREVGDTSFSNSLHNGCG